MKDSVMLWMVVVDYIVIMCKFGDNVELVVGMLDVYYGMEIMFCGLLVQESWMWGCEVFWFGDEWYLIVVWQRYVELVWMDIVLFDVLFCDDVCEEKDEWYILLL